MTQRSPCSNSSVQGGDAVWEGLRVYNEGIFCLERHLDRLAASAHALHFQQIPDRIDIRNAIFDTLEANNMGSDCHIRLTLTRGEKITSGMDPRLNQSGCGLIVLAEWKPPVFDNEKGIRVIASSQRRNSPQFLDSKIHHNNLLNNILAKIQANVAGVDAAIMLDERGFVSELNDTNIFMVKQDRIFTPSARNCLPGITRSLVMECASELQVECREVDLSLTEFYTADEVFASGTMGELTPITKIDGRMIGTTEKPVLDKLRSRFEEKIPGYCERR